MNKILKNKIISHIFILWGHVIMGARRKLNEKRYYNLKAVFQRPYYELRS